MSRRLYLEDSYIREFDTEIVACDAAWCRFAATAFHPGGGGQPFAHGSTGLITITSGGLGVTGGGGGGGGWG